MEKLFESIFSSPNYRVIVIILFATAIALGIALSVPKWKSRRPLLSLIILIVSVVAILLAANMEYASRFFKSVFPNENYRLTVSILFMGMIALIVSLFI